MEMDFVLIGKRIKQIRISKGITQVSLANMLDCDPCYVSKLESGSKKTSISRIVAVADALEVSVDQLLGRISSRNDKDDIINLVSDCTPYERRLILGTIAGLKQVIREEANRKHE